MKTATLTLTTEEADYLVGCFLARDHARFAKMGYDELPDAIAVDGLLKRLQAARRAANPFLDYKEQAA